jgi:large subunit ribosomal protein L32e
MEKKKPKFLRRTSTRYSKLGRKRKKKQVWKKPKGRDNKMREKRRGYPAVVSIGYGNKKIVPARIIHNLKELEKIKADEMVILGKVGKKSKLEIVKKAKEMKVNIKNANIDKIIKKLSKVEGEKK